MRYLLFRLHHSIILLLDSAELLTYAITNPPPLLPLLSPPLLPLPLFLFPKLFLPSAYLNPPLPIRPPEQHPLHPPKHERHDEAVYPVVQAPSSVPLPIQALGDEEKEEGSAEEGGEERVGTDLGEGENVEEEDEGDL